MLLRLQPAATTCPFESVHVLLWLGAAVRGMAGGSAVAGQTANKRGLRLESRRALANAHAVTNHGDRGHTYEARFHGAGQKAIIAATCVAFVAALATPARCDNLPVRERARSAQARRGSERHGRWICSCEDSKRGLRAEALCRLHSQRTMLMLG
jgi:hypothetical protein